MASIVRDSGSHERGKPWHFKYLTVRDIYHPLARSYGKIYMLLKALKAQDGDRQKKLFQFLNEIGARALRIHLGRVLEMAESSANKYEYERKITQRFGGQLGVGFYDARPFQRFAAAFRAIALRRFLDKAVARAFPPLLPSSAAALFCSTSVTSPVAICMMRTALPITSAGRFSPRGPLGILTGWHAERSLPSAGKFKLRHYPAVPIRRTAGDRSGRW